MNTGIKIETKRLLLLPGLTARDSAPFLQMLREDGDFRMYCGAAFSEDNLRSFSDYFERSQCSECMYSFFRKEEPKRFIGYVGFHQEKNYELEFYVSRPYRNQGYCTEAATAAIGQLFGKGLHVDGNILTVDRLYSTTIAENASAVRVLQKLGFKRNLSKDEPVLLMVGFIDDDGNLIDNWVEEYVLTRDLHMELFRNHTDCDSRLE